MGTVDRKSTCSCGAGVRRTVISALCLILVWTVAVLPARADQLFGTGGISYGVAPPVGFTTKVNDTGVLNYTITSGSNEGTSETKVWSDSSGNLAFEYITNPSGSSPHVRAETIAAGDPAVWPGDDITSVDVTAGDLAPDTTLLLPGLRELGFQWTTSALPERFLTGPSDIWVVTSDKAYGVANEGILDGAGTNVTSFAPVPEPAVVIGLAGIAGMMGLGLVLRRQPTT